jgi:pyridoxine kinase
MNLLSIQSSVAYGHVGNSAAVPALQALGIEAWPVDTVTLAHHPGHGAWRGRVTEPAELSTLIEGLAAVGALDRCDGVLSGYLGDACQGPVLLDAVARVKAARPAALYCCDPVMGERDKGFYVRPGVPEFLRDRALPRADLLMPNLFELGWLVGREIDDIEGAREAARSLLARGPRLVVVKGPTRTAHGRPRIGALAVTARSAWRVETPLVDAPASGAGDLFAALFLGRHLRSRDPARALEHAVAAVHGVLTRTAADGTDELALVATRGLLSRPKRLFKAVKMG